MINVLICGIGGKMGASVLSILSPDGEAKAVCGVDSRTSENCGVPVYKNFDDVKEKVDVVIDFSSPAALKSELDWAVKNGVPVVLATTGYGENDIRLIEDASKKTAVFRTANFSLGVNLLVKLVREAAQALGGNFDVEIIEKHHNQKVDAPSGTALMLAESANFAYGGSKPYLYGRQATRNVKTQHVVFRKGKR